ncbi:MAG: helix-hairpin-helix domain-containing protein [Sinobacteraceae bacterium]|nr:helix-hairpin-helix domain-containing protein [Nevskiaceae bacterium]
MAPAKAKVSEKATRAEALPSVNTASADELAAIKGLSKTVAQAIVAGRPYASLDELTRAKGMGEKLLAKLRQQLSL